MIKPTTLFVLALLSAPLSGCETLSDPNFRDIMQGASAQLSRDTQSLNQLDACLRSAPNTAVANNCTLQYAREQ